MQHIKQKWRIGHFGGYLGAAKFVDDKQRWRRYIKDSIVNTGVEKDVIMTSNIIRTGGISLEDFLSCNVTDLLWI